MFVNTTFKQGVKMLCLVATMSLAISCDKDKASTPIAPKPTPAPVPAPKPTPTPTEPKPEYKLMSEGALALIKAKLPEGEGSKELNYYFGLSGTDIWQDKNLNGTKDTGEELYNNASLEEVALTIPIDKKTGIGVLALYGKITNLSFLADEDNSEEEENTWSFNAPIYSELDLSKAESLSALSWRKAGLRSVVLPKTEVLSSLHLSENQLKSIDLPEPSKLTVFVASKNEFSGKLDLSKHKALKSINVADNKLEELLLPSGDQLTFLNCHGNQLSKLDISVSRKLGKVLASKNKLKTLELGISDDVLKELLVDDNQLTSLDTKGYLGLKKLNCSANKLSKLEVNNTLGDLNCSANTELTKLELNPTKEGERIFLTKLNASGCTKLESIKLTSATILSEIALHGAKALTGAKILDGLPQVSGGKLVLDQSLTTEETAKIKTKGWTVSAPTAKPKA